MKKLVFALIIGMLAGLAPTFAQEELPDRLVLGMVPSREADAIVDSLEPLAEMLSERLLIPVDTFIATNYVGVVEALGTGRVDIALLGPAAMVQAMDRFGAKVAFASVRFGSPTYKSQFNVRCDSGIEDFEALAGTTMAWVDPGSTSGYQFPYVYLRDEVGLDPDADLNGFFAGSHDAAVLAVYNGDADVAVSFNDARTAIEEDFPDVMEQVCVLGYTQDIPNDGAVVRADLSDELVEQIADAFIDIAETEEGQALTQELFNVTSFARVDPALYDVVRDVSATFTE